MSTAFLAPMELKLADGGQPGEVEGYGAVFGNVDSHGDVILPGAFAAALAQHKAAGTMPAMYVEHGPALGGDSLPAGIWTEMTDDGAGLRVKGRISALDTDYGKRIRGLVGDGALKGMSIGYKVGAGNAIMGRTAGQPRRQIKSFERLYEVSLVTAPSNTRAQVDSIKKLSAGERDKAAEAVAHAIRIHDKAMAAPYSDGNARDKAMLMEHLRNAHEALTGTRTPDGVDGWKSALNIDVITAALREAGLTEEQAAEFAALGLKTAPERTGGDPAHVPAELTELGSLCANFSLSSL